MNNYDVKLSHIDDLINKLLYDIEVTYSNEDGDQILFKTIFEDIYKMYHQQGCCEKVYISDICGELNDLIGAKIIDAWERTNSERTEFNSETWTFYEISTDKGFVNFRWYGTSNGYYSESVCIEKIYKEKNPIDINTLESIWN